ncbi:MAG: ferrous iron transport protein A [Clostridia bacterium]|nr:ferrous iron transport protein A [Clostridia bacterium]
MEKLIKCRVGKLCKVDSIDKAAPLKIKRRLLELGFTCGQAVKIIRKSLFGQTYLIEIRGYLLSIRKSLTDYIVVG